jgi:ABC-type amino acid transport substrate-binding protein
VASGIGGVKDLSGKRVGMIANTTTDKALAAALGAASIKAQMVSIADHQEGLRGLEEGRLDAYASDHLLLAALLAGAKDPAKLRLSREIFSYEPVLRSNRPSGLRTARASGGLESGRSRDRW